jgi:formate--tetrahydrofolate ligase
MLSAVVALNHFDSDSDAEVAVVEAFCRDRGVPMAVCRGWADGGPGASDLAREVVAVFSMSLMQPRSLGMEIELG